MFKNLFQIIFITLFIVQCQFPEAPDTEAPTVTLLSPGSVITEDFDAVIEASDDEKVVKVWIYFDNILIGETSTEPYRFEIDITDFIDGLQHSIQAFASDKAGNVGFSQTILFTIGGIFNDAPEIILTNPINNEEVKDTVLVSAEASDNESVTLVEFYVDGLLSGSDSTTPYQYYWDTTPYADGNLHSVYAKAYDNENQYSLSELSTVTVLAPIGNDITRPVITILYPLNGELLSGVVNISADVQDNDAVDYVEFFIDGEMVFTDSNELDGWVYSWDTDPYGDGLSHSVYLRAFDISANFSYSRLITVTVSNNDTTTLPDNTPPSINILYPRSGNILIGTVDITADVQDDGGVSYVEFYVDNNSLSSDNNGADGYSYSWDTDPYADGLSHSIYLKAADSSDNISYSNVVNVTVLIGEDATPPSVLIIYPLTNSTVTGTINIVADIFDNVGVSSAEFYIDGGLSDTDNNGTDGWSTSWNTSLDSSGLHSIYIRAYDAENNVGTSNLISVTVP